MLCAGTKVSYQEVEQILVTGGPSYNFTTSLQFDCEVFNFAEDKIIMHFVVNSEPIAQVYDTRNPDTVSDTSTI